MSDKKIIHLLDGWLKEFLEVEEKIIIKRLKREIFCAPNEGGCGKYFLIFLAETLTGHITIECPGCGHHHFRVLRGSIFTDDRPSLLVMGMKSTLANYPWTTRTV